MRIRPTLVIIALAGLALAGCGDDTETIGAGDGGADQASDNSPVPLAEWVAEFDRICVETGAELSDPSLSEAEFADISLAALTEMRAIGEPDEQADSASVVLDVIEAQAAPSGLTDEQITEQDARFLEAATTLGVSDECIGGAEG